MKSWNDLASADQDSAKKLLIIGAIVIVIALVYFVGRAILG